MMNRLGFTISLISLFILKISKFASLKSESKKNGFTLMTIRDNGSIQDGLVQLVDCRLRHSSAATCIKTKVVEPIIDANKSDHV